MLVAFSVAPNTAQDNDDGSVADSVVEAVKIVRDSGLPYEVNSMFTTVEGEWDEVFDVIKRASDAVTTSSSRVSLVIKADIRPGHTNQLSEKVQRINQRLDE